MVAPTINAPMVSKKKVAKEFRLFKGIPLQSVLSTILNTGFVFDFAYR